MATVNPFDLLGDDDTEDLSQLMQKIEPKKALAPSATPKHQPQTKTAAAAANAKLPSKPLPPAQAVREAKSDSARGGRGGRGYGRGRGSGGGRGYNRDSTNNENSYGNMEISGGQGASGEADTRKPFERHGGYGGPRGPYGGGRRGGFSNGEVGEGEQERPRRVFDRHSGSGHGNEMKREGAGRGNWGAQTYELAEVTDEAVSEGEKNLNEKPSGEEDAADGNKETSAIEIEEKEPEDKEMTLEEYEKVLEEKRKALQDLKTEERKVDVKEFESMQQLANKKNSDDIFIKLGSSLKDKTKELAEKEERAKKSVSINEFLRPPEGKRFYNPGLRRRGLGSRGGYNGDGEMSNVKAPAIEDPGQFPTLGAK